MLNEKLQGTVSVKPTRPTGMKKRRKKTRTTKTLFSKLLPQFSQLQLQWRLLNYMVFPRE
jgi:hypothetical protein